MDEETGEQHNDLKKLRETAIGYILLGNGAGLVTVLASVQTYLSDGIKAYDMSAALFVTLCIFAIGESLAAFALFVQWRMTRSFDLYLTKVREAVDSQKVPSPESYVESITSRLRELNAFLVSWSRSWMKPDNLFLASSIAFVLGIWIAIAGVGWILLLK